MIVASLLIALLSIVLLAETLRIVPGRARPSVRSPLRPTLNTRTGATSTP